MDQTVVHATSGRELGSRPSNRLRASGNLPAVVYGLGLDPVNVAVNYVDLRDALKSESGLNTILSLDVDGEKSETAIVKDVQRDPIKQVVTHVDFLRIDTSKPIQVSVPIVLIGDGTAITAEGAVIEQKLFELDVEVSPLRIPDVFEVDQSVLTMDTVITVADIDLPDGVTSLIEDDAPVVAPAVSRAAKMSEDEEGEGEEAEESDGEDGGSDSE